VSLTENQLGMKQQIRLRPTLQ